MEVEQPGWLLQMEDLLEGLNEGVIISDDCHHIIFANSVFVGMIGIPTEDLLGHGPADFYTPEENKVIEHQTEVASLAGRARFEFVLPLKDGSRLPVIISTRQLEDPEGRRFAIITFTDISEQKRAEAELRAANAQLEERQNEIDSDLSLASRVQQTLAPQSLVWGRFRVDAYFRPARSIGGDFGVVMPRGDTHLDLLLCDVSGHGIGSALVANRIYTETLSLLRNGTPLGDMLRHLNRFVMQTIGSSIFFFTLAAARFDRDARRIIFAGAGHPPAMVVTPGEEPRLLESRSMVLGALPEAVGVEATLDVDLLPGDRVVLYTDGITDVFNAAGEMLGVAGVEKFVRETSSLPLSDMKQAILARVAEWREGASVDDVSLLLAEVL